MKVPVAVPEDVLRRHLLMVAKTGRGKSSLIQRLAVHAIYLPDRHPPAKVRAFIDFIARRFAPEPPWDRGLT